MRYVFKFGGSSLGSAKKIMNVAKFLKEQLQKEDCELIIVVSAMAQTTNNLETFAKKLNIANNSYHYSELVTLGEMVSAKALCLALNSLDIEATCLSAKDIKIHGIGHPKNAIITHIDKQNIENVLKKQKIVIVNGFQCVNENDEILTLGRGGSDTTAVALGATFNACVKIFTDVAGVLSSDPKLGNNAKTIKSINILSSIELAHGGAKVIAPRSVEICNKYKLNVGVFKSLTEKGTQIVYSQIESHRIDAISDQNDLKLVKTKLKKANNLHVNNFSTNYFYLLTSLKTDNYHFNFWLTNKENLNMIPKNKIKNSEIIDCSLITIIGSGFTTHTEILNKLNNFIKREKINVILQNINPTTIKLVLKNKNCSRIVKKLAFEFNL